MTERAWRGRLHARRTPATNALASRIYPYLVTDKYPDGPSGATQRRRQIGNGLAVTLVATTTPGPTDFGVLAPVSDAQLTSAGIDLDTAYAQAERNLSSELSNGQIKVEFFDRGPAGAPTVVVNGSCFAATVLVAAGLYPRMTRLLGSDAVAAVPDRGLLFVFPPAAVHVMTDVVHAEFRNAANPLTDSLFTLGERERGPLPGTLA